MGFFWPFLAHLRHFEHKNSEISKKNFKISKLAFFDYFWLHVAAMGSGVSGIDTSNIWRVLGLYSQKFGDSGGSGETFFSENQSQWRILETWKKNGQSQELLLVSLLHPLKEISFSCQIILTKQICPKMTIFLTFFQKNFFSIFFFFPAIPSCYMVLRGCVIYFMVKLNIPGCAVNPRPEKRGHMTHLLAI